MSDMRNAAAKARDKYLASEAGQASCDATSIGAPARMGVYLQNRIAAAFLAGRDSATPPASQESAGEAFRPDWTNYRQGVADGKAEAADTIATLTAELADRNKAVIAQAGNVRALADALKTLTQAARISGGVAGPDSNLMAACDKAENALSLTGVGCAVNAVLDVMEQRDSLRDECERLREQKKRLISALTQAGHYILDDIEKSLEAILARAREKAALSASGREGE